MNKNIIELPELNKETIKGLLYEIRGQKVMLDFELAEIYGYETKKFNQQVKNNKNKFPDDFMFKLTQQEQSLVLRSKNLTAKSLSSKRRYLPYAFTEQGIYEPYDSLIDEIVTYSHNLKK